jgi:hypothetical protein
MVEPRYDQYSTEGAFFGKLEVVDLGERRCGDEFSLWTFRRILKNTPLVGAGGYDANSARDAVAEGKSSIWISREMLTDFFDRKGGSCCLRQTLHFKS